jgi:hypothetical protein
VCIAILLAVSQSGQTDSQDKPGATSVCWEGRAWSKEGLELAPEVPSHRGLKQPSLLPAERKSDFERDVFLLHLSAVAGP